jgi:hypothetical protein
VAAAAVRAHRLDRALAAGPSAALAVWAVHSAVDWDWELPALTLFALVAAGLLVAVADGVPEDGGAGAVAATVAAPVPVAAR